jgi:pimeloyl-ACP methyl ester carboxylesterase
VVLVGHSLGGIAIQALWDGELADVVRRRVAGIVLVNTTFTAELAGWRGGGTRPQRAYERVDDVAQRLIGSERIVRRLRPRDSDLTMLGARVVYGKDPSPSHLAASVRIYRETPSATIAASIDLATTDLYHVLPHIDVPALVVGGTHDRIAPPFLSEEIAARVPDAELVLLDDCGHIAPFERHEELNTLIAKFSATVLGESSDGGARFSLGQRGVL